MLQHRLQFLRVGVAQLIKIANDVIARWDVGRIGNNRDAGAARIFAGRENFYNIGLGRHERVAVHEQIDFDDLDRFVARRIGRNENVHLALDGVVGHHAFTGEHLVITQNVRHVAVRKLQLHRIVRICGRSGDNPGWSGRGRLSEAAQRRQHQESCPGDARHALTYESNLAWSTRGPDLQSGQAACKAVLHSNATT